MRFSYTPKQINHLLFCLEYSKKLLSGNSNKNKCVIDVTKFDSKAKCLSAENNFQDKHQKSSFPL